jgi:hypothetical protein
MTKITHPVFELLAIKLFEHDANDGRWPPGRADQQSWRSLKEEWREVYRRMARGQDDYPAPPSEDE